MEYGIRALVLRLTKDNTQAQPQSQRGTIVRNRVGEGETGGDSRHLVSGRTKRDRLGHAQ